MNPRGKDHVAVLLDALIGFDAHLVKPVDMDALEDLLRVLGTPA